MPSRITASLGNHLAIVVMVVGAAQVAAIIHNLPTAISIVVQGRSALIAIARLAYGLQRIALSPDIAATLPFRLIFI